MKIEDWLKKIDCEEYVSVFKENGICDFALSVEDTFKFRSDDKRKAELK